MRLSNPRTQLLLLKVIKKVSFLQISSRNNIKGKLYITTTYQDTSSYQVTGLKKGIQESQITHNFHPMGIL